MKKTSLSWARSMPKESARRKSRLWNHLRISGSLSKSTLKTTLASPPLPGGSRCIL